jgi:hypothetical protein
MAEGGHIALANGGQFTLVLGGQFAWIFQVGAQNGQFTGALFMSQVL